MSVKTGPSTHANLISPPTVTRHPPPHSGAVNHDRIQRNHGLNTVRLCYRTNKLHHRHRSDCYDHIILISFINQFLQSWLPTLFCRKNRHLSQHQSVGSSFHFFFQYHNIFISESGDSGQPLHRWNGGILPADTQSRSLRRRRLLPPFSRFQIQTVCRAVRQSPK